MQLKPIIQAKFKKFKDSYELNQLVDGIAFERFVNHSILTFHQPDAFTADSDFLEKVCVGGEADTGIDGIAIKINGILIKNTDDIDEITQRPKDINVEFIFIQSKYKPNFDVSEFLKFIAGVRNFLSDNPILPCNSKVKEMIELKKYVFNDKFIAKWDSNPTVKLYYAAMGSWRNDSNITAHASQAKQDILALNIYENPEIQYVDEEVLKSICDSNENRFDVTISAYDIMELTPVEGVNNSCIAVCYATEFMKMLSYESGEIRKSLFEDNVRDYQGENVINNEIASTIQKDPTKFILMNNGITIVCDDFKTSTKKITINNPQIVNGCQTSHVLFYNHLQGYDLKQLPLNIKIIATEDISISNQIVRGNNRQNQVLEEAFETTRPFHQRLEEFFNSYSSEHKIYYERRSKQYNHNPTIKKTQIINLRILVQAFIGMFLNKPHESHKHEARLLRETKGEIFLDKQSYLPYYTSAIAFYNIERLFRDGMLSNIIKPFKSHMLMMFREAIAGKVPSINMPKYIDEHCNTMMNVLQDDKKFLETFLQLNVIFENAKNIWINEMGKSRDGMKDVSEFTELLLQQVRKQFPIKKELHCNDSEHKYYGIVQSTLLDKNYHWYGFIKREPENIFFHSAQNRDLDFNNLRGRNVEYAISINPKNDRPVAINVKCTER